MVTLIVYKTNTNINPSEAYLELRYPELSQTTYITNNSKIYGEGMEACRHETIRAVLPCLQL